MVRRGRARRAAPYCTRRAGSVPGGATGGDHQAQALKQDHRSLGGATPDQLAALSLAVLHVDVAAGILQAAILEGAVNENPVVQNKVLVFKNFRFVSSHRVRNYHYAAVAASGAEKR